jgi:hypothetical protein
LPAPSASTQAEPVEVIVPPFVTEPEPPPMYTPVPPDEIEPPVAFDTTSDPPMA